MTKLYEIVYGRMQSGRPCIAHYRNLADARKVASKIFDATGIVVGITEINEPDDRHLLDGVEEG